jgi:soluble lytic murein transglycosylase-like protein
MPGPLAGASKRDVRKARRIAKRNPKLSGSQVAAKVKTSPGYVAAADRPGGRAKAQRERRTIRSAYRTIRQAGPDLNAYSGTERTAAELAYRIGKEMGVMPSLLMGLMEIESGFDPNAVSSMNAGGLTQFIPGTAASYDVRYGNSPAAMESQVRGAARYLKDLGLKDDVRLALASYNAGPGNPQAAGDYPENVLAAAQGYRNLDRPAMTPASRQARQTLREMDQPLPKVTVKAKPSKPATIEKIGKIAQNRFGLTVGENAAFTGVTPTGGHADGSFHYSNAAIDVTGDSNQLMAFNKFVARKYGSDLEELFYDPGINIDNGQASSPIGGHGSHVHVAETTNADTGYYGPMTGSGMVPSGGGSMGGSAASGGSGGAMTEAERRRRRRVRAIQNRPLPTVASPTPDASVSSLRSLAKKYGVAI